MANKIAYIEQELSGDDQRYEAEVPELPGYGQEQGKGTGGEEYQYQTAQSPGGRKPKPSASD